MATLVTLHEFATDIAVAINNTPTQYGFEFVKGEALSHEISVSIKNNGADVSLSGASAMIYVVRSADGRTVTISADIDGNTISKALGAECFAYTGRIYILATVTIGGITRVVLNKYTSVKDGITDAVVDPGSVLPNLAQLLAFVSAHSVIGNYNPSISYNQFNQVYWDPATGGDGCSYIWADETPSVAGTDPSESANWQKVAQGGTVRVSNPNLLDNPYFLNPVNDNGLSTYTWASGMLKTINRWVLYVSGVAVFSSDGLSLENTGSEVRFEQFMENYTELDGKTLTISCIVDGVLYQGTGVFTAGTGDISFSAIINDDWSLRVVSGTTFMGIRLYSNVASAALPKITYAKLEIGDISTALNDPPPRFGRQQQDCQRFDAWLSGNVRVDALNIYANYIDFLIPLPVEMRITPSMDSALVFVVKSVGGTTQSGFTFEVLNSSIAGVVIRATKTSHGLSENAALAVFTPGSLDANL